MSLAREFGESRLKPTYVRLGRMVYRCRRVNADALLAEGYAHLEGSSSAREAVAQIEKQRKVEYLKSIGAAADDASALEKVELSADARNRARFEAWASTPAGAKAMRERANAYVCAAIDGAGRVRDDYTSTARLELLDESVLEDVLDQERGGHGIEPWRFVREEGQQDYDKGVVWVHALAEVERVSLGMAIQQLNSVAGEVQPFRGGPRDARPSRSAGEPVRGAAARGARVDAPADGDQRGGARSPRRGDGGKGGGREAGRRDGGPRPMTRKKR